MDHDVKICPECGAEYYAHVDMCRGCDVALVFPGQAPQKRAADAGDSPLVCIEESSPERLGELIGALMAVGIEGKVLKMTAKGGCGGGGTGLFVPEALAKEAVTAIDEYWLNKHPELKEMEDMLNSGQCPACGADIKVTTSGFVQECPDCGLNLGGPAGGDCDTGSGGCSTC